IVDGEHQIEMLIRSEAPAAAAVVATTVATAPAHGRLAFFDALAASIAAAGQQKDKRAAVLVTVDDFAGNEDRLGLHDAVQAVDQCLEWLQKRIGPQDQLFRFSTHEIACILVRPAVPEIIDFGEGIIRDIGKQIFNTAGHEAQLSLTVAAYPFAGSEQAAALTAELVRDTRKLSANGGGQFANVGPSAKSSLDEVEDARKAALVKKAIEDSRLKLAYQSIASLEGDTRQHFDVLVRIVDENGSELHASEFIRAAEKHNLVGAIDRWVTARALKVQSKREGAQDASSLFIKVSEDTLKDAEGFVAWFAEQVKTRPLKPGELVFELRELVVQNHIRKARMLTKALTELGAQIAIEHFGIGSNSPQMLEHI
ncbi:MAG: EAL domain-containing protein, partial [Hydrocarboniphaga effusa]|nr:EAL domain-containing protein [Hydrocarboniphaga effusa]